MSVHTLMFGWEFPPLHSGGLGVACEGLVRGLLQGGTRVTLVLPHGGDQGGGQFQVLAGLTGGEYEEIPVESMLRPYEGATEFASRVRLEHPETWGGQDLYGPGLMQAVEEYTARSVSVSRHVRPDVVHAHDWMTFGAAARAAAYHKVPMIAHVHATELDRTNGCPDPRIFERERQGLLMADRVIAVSAYTRDMLIREYGIRPDRISVVHNGHDAPPPPPLPPLIESRTGKRRPPLVLFLGRLTVQKNPEQFLQVAARIHAERPDARFVMAGTGPMLGRLMELACELNLQDSLVFAGKVDRGEAEALYAGADCFVMPSLSEPFGLVALEAIAHGVPVVLSKQSGVGEVLDHAFKVDFWDTDKMADCILTVLRDDALARQLRSEAPRLLQRLSWVNQAGAVRSIYDQLRAPRA